MGLEVPIDQQFSAHRYPPLAFSVFRLPKEPLNPACPWTCSLPGCSSQTESSTVRDMVANFEKDLETVGESVEDLETLLVTLGQTLHPQHYLMMTGKRRLLASLHSY